MVPQLLPRDYVLAGTNVRATVQEAESYTKWLSNAHYENFHVVSFLLPKHLHQDFYNVYSFCRWSDDLGDEFGDTAKSIELLTEWREQLHAMFAGEASHPVFVALQQTVNRHQLPMSPFDDLLSAFLHDQTVTRYANWPEVFAYCKNSANPVGRLVLMLCGYRDEQRFHWSDQTCTALQLANFWQDVSVDLKKDRVYIPQTVLDRYGYTVEDLFAGRENDKFVGVMREVCAETQKLFQAGLPLISTVDKRLAIDLDLFSRGGMKILDKIGEQGFLVLHRRPKISKLERVGLLLATLVRIGPRKST